jgi:sialic acid synthase SpsE
MIEVHFTPHKRYFGPDVSSSLLASEIKFLVDAASAFGTLRQSSSTREEYLLSVSDTKRLFRKGIYWADSFEVGHTITKDSFLFLKPVAEFDAVNYEELVGRKVSKNVQKANEVRSTDFN